MVQGLLDKRIIGGTEQEKRQPATYADARLITGDQGAGKTTIGVGFAIEDYYKNLTGIVSPSGEFLKAKSVERTVNRGDWLWLRRAGIYPNIFKYVRVFSDSGGQSKLIRFPKDWLAVSPVHIFANFHLYGIKFRLIYLADIIQNINTEMFHDAWVLFDESGEMDARRSMENVEKMGNEFYATIRKRRTHFCAMVQYNEQIERRIRLFAKWRVLCSYDRETKWIECDIRKPDEPEFTTDFYAPRYWPFFDTEELIRVPQYKIDRTLEKMSR